MQHLKLDTFVIKILAQFQLTERHSFFENEKQTKGNSLGNGSESKTWRNVAEKYKVASLKYKIISWK